MVGVVEVVVVVVVVAYLIDVAISDCHSLHRTTTKKLRKYSNLNELRRIWQLNAVWYAQLVLSPP